MQEEDKKLLVILNILYVKDRKMITSFIVCSHPVSKSVFYFHYRLLQSSPCVLSSVMACVPKKIIIYLEHSFQDMALFLGGVGGGGWGGDILLVCDHPSGVPGLFGQDWTKFICRNQIFQIWRKVTIFSVFWYLTSYNRHQRPAIVRPGVRLSISLLNISPGECS